VASLEYVIIWNNIALPSSLTKVAQVQSSCHQQRSTINAKDDGIMKYLILIVCGSNESFRKSRSHDGLFVRMATLINDISF